MTSLEESWPNSDDERRSSYEVVALDQLPADGMEMEAPPPDSQRPCGCWHCDGDWAGIAAASVEALEHGIDPIDSDAVDEFALTHLEEDRDRCWFASLFGDPITVLRGGNTFVNGRHRAHAMRLSGVKTCVVYTGAGER